MEEESRMRQPLHNRSASPSHANIFRELDRTAAELRKERMLREMALEGQRRSFREQKRLTALLHEARHSAASAAESDDPDSVGLAAIDSLPASRDGGDCNEADAGSGGAGCVVEVLGDGGTGGACSSVVKGIVRIGRPVAATAPKTETVHPVPATEAPTEATQRPTVPAPCAADVSACAAAGAGQEEEQEGVEAEEEEELGGNLSGGHVPAPAASAAPAAGASSTFSILTHPAAPVPTAKANSLQTPCHVWQPNTSSCSVCRLDFDLAFRRHHCRQCGRCVCAGCSPFRVHLARPAERPGDCGLLARRRPPHDSEGRQPWALATAHRVCYECYFGSERMCDDAGTGAGAADDAGASAAEGGRAPLASAM